MLIAKQLDGVSEWDKKKAAEVAVPIAVKLLRERYFLVGLHILLCLHLITELSINTSIFVTVINHVVRWFDQYTCLLCQRFLLYGPHKDSPSFPAKICVQHVLCA